MKSLFTLVELLVVIAIISVLASLLLPTLQTARESAIGVSCLSRLKDIGYQFEMYASEYNDYIPPPLCDTKSGTLWEWPQPTWASLLLPYGGVPTQATYTARINTLSNYDNYGCPALPKKNKSSTLAKFEIYGMSSCLPKQWTSFAPNAGGNPFQRSKISQGTPVGTSYVTIGNLSRTYLVADTIAQKGRDEAWQQLNFFSFGSPYFSKIALRHVDTSNVLMADGSCKAEGVADLKDVNAVDAYTADNLVINL